MTTKRRNSLRIALRGVLLAVGATTVVQCGGGSDVEIPGCGAVPCPVTASTAHVTSGEIRLSVAWGDPEIYRVGEECTAEYQTLPLPGPKPLHPPWPFIVCRAGGREIDISAGFAMDLRELIRDRRTYSAEYSAPQMSFTVSAQPNCLYTVREDKLTIDVTDTNGESTASQPFVTSDYYRRMTLHIEAARKNADCDAITVTGDLVIEQAASDYVTREKICYCL